MTDQFYTDKAELEKSIMKQMEEFALRYGVSVLFEGRISVDVTYPMPEVKTIGIENRNSFIRYD